MLSAFDGIGAAPWLVSELAGRPLLAVAWEIDPACIHVAERRMPWLQQRGDLFADKVDDILHLISEADPQAQATVIWTAAPPCQDFSRMRSAGPGHDGERGGLFLRTVEFQKALFDRLGPRRTAFLYENVVMTKANADVITEALGHSPVFACGGDFGWITRPRLWWTSIKWDQVTHDIVDGRRLQWARHDGVWSRLRLPNDRKSADQFELGDLKFHEGVASGRLRMPCCTTPASDENGRPAPKGARGKTDEATRQRWLQDKRQFAPWHYKAIRRRPCSSTGTRSCTSPRRS